MKVKCLSIGLYLLKNSHKPFGNGFQPPSPLIYGQIPFGHLKSLKRGFPQRAGLYYIFSNRLLLECLVAQLLCYWWILPSCAILRSQQHPFNKVYPGAVIVPFPNRLPTDCVAPSANTADVSLLPIISATFCSKSSMQHKHCHCWNRNGNFHICMIMGVAIISIIPIRASNMSELWQGNSRDSKIQSSRLVSDWSLQYREGAEKW